MHDRFDRDQKELLIRQLFHIRQTSSVADYVKQFSELIDQLSAYSSNTDPMYFTTRFIDGLRPDIKSIVLVMRPQTLHAASSIALLQVEVTGNSGATQARRGDWSAQLRLLAPPAMPRPALPLPPPPPWPSAPPLVALAPSQPATGAPPADAKLSALKAYRRALGLCYKCGAKWSKDHRCSLEVLHAVDVLWDSFSSDDSLADSCPGTWSPEQILLALSNSAISGVPAARTIRLTGKLQDIPVHILIDSSSSSSFVNESLVHQVVNAPIQGVSSSVQIAGGGMLLIKGLVRAVRWTVDGCLFSSDFRILPLANIDVVIGMDWLEAFSPMQVDWKHKWLAVPYEGSVPILQGHDPVAPQYMLFQLEQMAALPSPSTQCSSVPPAITSLLSEFEDLFQEPVSLPPSRDCDHEIPFILGAQLVFLRQYRYSPKLKDEIESQVQDILNHGLIQRSASAFSSPVLLVKKKDGTYRFCVDFRHLNAITQKSKFPVPVFDNLWMNSMVLAGFPPWICGLASTKFCLRLVKSTRQRFRLILAGMNFV